MRAAAELSLQTDAARERARSAIRAGQVESTSARGPAPAELLLEWTPPAPDA